MKRISLKSYLELRGGSYTSFVRGGYWHNSEAFSLRATLCNIVKTSCKGNLAACVASRLVRGKR